jgi:hypothetical protein
MQVFYHISTNNQHFKISYINDTLRSNLLFKPFNEEQWL